jgi:hypothetical protein
VRQIRGEQNAVVSDRLAAIGNQLLIKWERAREKGDEQFVPQRGRPPAEPNRRWTPPLECRRRSSRQATSI